MAYQHLLIASDLSAASVKLCQRAKELATHLQAELSIIHVIEHPPLIYAGGEFALPLDLDLEETLAKEARETLYNQGLHHGISKEHQWVLVGSKKEEIVHFAKEHKVDLILVGAHDRHGLQLLLGSTAGALFHALPCDVLAVRVDV